jgi:hypothetical protein
MATLMKPPSPPAPGLNSSKYLSMGTASRMSWTKMPGTKKGREGGAGGGGRSEWGVAGGGWREVREKKKKGGEKRTARGNHGRPRPGRRAGRHPLLPAQHQAQLGRALKDLTGRRGGGGKGAGGVCCERVERGRGKKRAHGRGRALSRPRGRCFFFFFLPCPLSPLSRIFHSQRQVLVPVDGGDGRPLRGGGGLDVAGAAPNFDWAGRGEGEASGAGERVRGEGEAKTGGGAGRGVRGTSPGRPFPCGAPPGPALAGSGRGGGPAEGGRRAHLWRSGAARARRRERVPALSLSLSLSLSAPAAPLPPFHAPTHPSQNPPQRTGPTQQCRPCSCRTPRRRRRRGNPSPARPDRRARRAPFCLFCVVFWGWGAARSLVCLSLLDGGEVCGAGVARVRAERGAPRKGEGGRAQRKTRVTARASAPAPSQRTPASIGREKKKKTTKHARALSPW